MKVEIVKHGVMRDNKHFRASTITMDKRFKPGNIKRVGNELRGHPKTMTIKRLELPLNNMGLPFVLNPPIIVSKELGKKLKEVM